MPSLGLSLPRAYLPKCYKNKEREGRDVQRRPRGVDAMQQQWGGNVGIYCCGQVQLTELGGGILASVVRAMPAAFHRQIVFKYVPEGQFDAGEANAAVAVGAACR